MGYYKLAEKEADVTGIFSVNKNIYLTFEN